MNGMRSAALNLVSLCVIAAWPAWAAAQDLEFHATGSANDAATPGVMRDLAERLLPVYQEPDPDRYLANLSALQMAADDYVAADASRQSLRERRRRADSGRPVGRAILYDIYAHAKALETQDRIPFTEAFDKTFDETIPRLSGHDAYAVAEWLRRLRRRRRMICKPSSRSSGHSTPSIKRMR